MREPLRSCEPPLKIINYVPAVSRRSREMLPWIHPSDLLRCYRLCKCKSANAHAPTVLESFDLDKCALPIHQSRHSTLAQLYRWAKARIKSARMTMAIKLDGNWSCFLSAKNTPPLTVTGSVIAPSARMDLFAGPVMCEHK